MDVESMTVLELKKELRSRGLKVSGKKAELIDRLTAALDAETIEESANNTDDHHNQHQDFSDFEEFINDEYKRLNKDGDHNNNDDGTEEAAANIDDIINNTDNTNIHQQEQDEEEEEEEEEKNILLDFETNGNETITPMISTTADGSGAIMADFNDDPNALNNKSKIEDRMNRFGTLPVTKDSDKIESRKRRFATMGISSSSPPAKKQRIDTKQERNKMLQRAQKFGTNLPKNVRLTKEECAVFHADKIERAKRFGTEHLLPAQIQKVEFDKKKAERMKRFKMNNDEIEDIKPSKNIIKADDEPIGSTKLMERKLRFGTLNEEDKQNERVKRFGGSNRGKPGQNKMNHRQFRNNQKFQKFRQYKKNNKRGQRGRGRGRGRGGGRGRNGGFGGNRNRGNFNGNTRIQFSAEDMNKINERKMRFNSL